MKAEDILKIEMQDNSADAKTIKEYLQKLLQELWCEGEEFSGEMPFGDRGWEYELYEALVVAKAIDGDVDEDGCLGDFNSSAGDKLISEAIATL